MSSRPLVTLPPLPNPPHRPWRCSRHQRSDPVGQRSDPVGQRSDPADGRWGGCRAEGSHEVPAGGRGKRREGLEGQVKPPRLSAPRLTRSTSSTAKLPAKVSIPLKF